MTATGPTSPDSTGIGPTFDAIARLRICNCAECGVLFAAPATLCVELADRREPLHCPRGHANTLPDSKSIPAVESAAAQLQLIGELQQLRHQLATAERELAVLRPQVAPDAPPTDKEIKRRAGILAGRCEEGAFGRLICRICGSAKNVSETGMRDHIRRAHKAEVADLPAAYFE